MPYTSDGSITYETIIERYNSDLANTIGNLVNRTIAMTHKYFDGEILPPAEKGDFDDELSALAVKTVEKVEKLLLEYRISDALDAILNLAKRSNKYIDETTLILAMMIVIKQFGTVLYNLLSIRFIAILLAIYARYCTKHI